MPRITHEARWVGTPVNDIEKTIAVSFTDVELKTNDAAGRLWKRLEASWLQYVEEAAQEATLQSEPTDSELVSMLKWLEENNERDRPASWSAVTEAIAMHVLKERRGDS